MRRKALETSAPPVINCVRLSFGSTQVLAILAGVKDVTRRPVRQRLEYFGSGDRRAEPNWNNPALWGIRGADGEPLTLAGADKSDVNVMSHRYGRPGDRLIGTETWRPKMIGGDTAAIEYRADGRFEIFRDREAWEGILSLYQKRMPGWKPARFMPTFATRLRREIVSVTHDRLHSIDETEIVREGVGWDIADREIFSSATDYFEVCWNNIYGESHPWFENGWVRRIEFKAVRT